MKKTQQVLTKNRGYFLVTILILAAGLIIITTGLIYLTINQKIHFQRNQEKTSARQVAEAGINYYLWHLAHDPEDYADGTGENCTDTCGPYIHEYKDQAGQIIGTYELIIQPPLTGQNFVTVTSEGRLSGSGESKTIEGKLGIPSFSRYSILSTERLWFGPSETSYGPVHSNIGVRHQGEAFDGIVTASSETYYCTIATCGQQGWYPGVWCDEPGCPKLHEGYNFPLPTVDFNAVTADLAQMKIDAQDKGLYLGPSGSKGYHIVLDGTNFRIYRVTQEGCTAANNTCRIWTQMGWQRVSDDIYQETPIGTHSFPENGIIFVEDDLWIEGTINEAELTFAAARFPDISSTNAQIVVNSDLLYTNYDGRDKIGLIAQKFITLPRASENDLEIDAAMIAQHGYVEWHHYNAHCPELGLPGDKCIYDQIKIYGTMATNGGLAWTWVSGGSEPYIIQSGYINTITEYDEHLYLEPPPSFPTTGSFTIMSWEEK